MSPFAVLDPTTTGFRDNRYSDPSSDCDDHNDAHHEK